MGATPPGGFEGLGREERTNATALASLRRLPWRLRTACHNAQLYAPPETRYGGMKESERKQMSDHDDEHRPVRRVLWARLLLILPFIAMLWVSSYNSIEPMAFGIPFFYWYQLLWVLIGAVMIAFVYAVER
jgi:hypothetical protein